MMSVYVVEAHLGAHGALSFCHLGRSGIQHWLMRVQKGQIAARNLRPACSVPFSAEGGEKWRAAQPPSLNLQAQISLKRCSALLLLFP